MPETLNYYDPISGKEIKCQTFKKYLNLVKNNSEKSNDELILLAIKNKTVLLRHVNGYRMSILDAINAAKYFIKNTE